MKTLVMSREDREFLDAYKKALEERFPGVVEDIIVYGSKTRGDAGPDSDLDVLVLIGEGDWRLKNALCDPATEFSVGTNVVPSIQVYTTDEWEKRRISGSAYRRAVERDGVSVR